MCWLCKNITDGETSISWLFSTLLPHVSTSQILTDLKLFNITGDLLMDLDFEKGHQHSPSDDDVVITEIHHRCCMSKRF